MSSIIPQFRNIFDSLLEGVQIHDFNWRYIYVNDALEKYSKYPKEELLGFTIMEKYPGIEQSDLFKSLQRCMKERTTEQLETEFVFPDGTTAYFELSVQPIPEGIFILSIDRSQQHKAKENLLQSESRLKEAQALAHISNWEIDMVHNIHTWSDGFYKIFGINRNEVQPSTELFLSLVHPDDVDFVQKKVQEAFGTLKASSFNFRFRYRDGSTRYGYSEWKFEFDKKNRPKRLYGILQDVTERKRSELKLEQQNEELIKANSELDRFVYSVSHDLRSPLTSMLGLITFIEDESQEPDTIEHARMIRNSINRLDGFIRNILLYSRNNRTGLEVGIIPLQKTIQEVVDSLSGMKEAKGIHFEVTIKEQQLFHSDWHRFNTIMENLISNAIKYHKTEGPGRYIKVTGVSDNEKLLITIADNGIGIASVYHDKIFDMFFRLCGKKDGSGIGLYIVKEVVEKLQGSIKVHSEEEKGTSFSITLKNLLP